MDLIERQAINDALDKIPILGKQEAGDEFHLLVSLAHIFTAIEALPSAQPEQLGTNLAEVGADCISRQAAIDVADAVWSVTGDKNVAKVWDQIKDLPSVQPERTCVNCGRTANNGGWYADGGTRCPIEEHYALPKDGYCHLWEKRNVTDDNYPERREE